MSYEMKSTEKFTVAPVKNPREHSPQWAVWQGNWQVAECWSESTADWIAELMNAGYEAILQKRITEILEGHQLGTATEKSSTSE